MRDHQRVIVGGGFSGGKAPLLLRKRGWLVLGRERGSAYREKGNLWEGTVSYATLERESEKEGAKVAGHARKNLHLRPRLTVARAKGDCENVFCASGKRRRTNRPRGGGRMGDVVESKDKGDKKKDFSEEGQNEQKKKKLTHVSKEEEVRNCPSRISSLGEDLSFFRLVYMKGR